MDKVLAHVHPTFDTPSNAIQLKVEVAVQSSDTRKSLLRGESNYTICFNTGVISKLGNTHPVIEVALKTEYKDLHLSKLFEYLSSDVFADNVLAISLNCSCIDALVQDVNDEIVYAYKMKAKDVNAQIRTLPIESESLSTCSVV